MITEKKFKKLNTYDLNYFRGKNYFDEDGTQNYYIFQPLGKYLEVTDTNNINYILSWQTRWLTNLKIESLKTNNYLLNLCIDHYDKTKIRIKFDGSFLNRFPPSIFHDEIVNIYIVYEITSDNASNYPILENCLFRSVKLTKNADISKYGYFGYGIRFDRRSSFSFGSDIGKNIIIFGVDMSSSTRIDNR